MPVVSVEELKKRVKDFDNPLIVVAIRDNKTVNDVFSSLKGLNADLCTYFTMETALKHMDTTKE